MHTQTDTTHRTARGIAPASSGSLRSARRQLAGWLTATALAAATATVSAGNILDNADFEGGWSRWTPDSPVSWNYYIESWPAHSGSLVFKAFGCWCGEPNFVSIYQDNPAAAGSTYTASGWIYSRSADHTLNYGWIQVEFLNAGGTPIEIYQSGRFTGADLQDTWLYYAVTNKMALDGQTVVGTVSTITAPAATTVVRVRCMHMQVAGGGGAIHYDDVELNQTGGNQPPQILNISPNQAVALFAPASSGFTFNAFSPTTNINASDIKVTLNGQDVSSSLVVTGPGGNRSVAYNGLKTNRIYSATVNVVDAAGMAKGASVIFDTFDANNFMWEAEDYDFNNANFINHPVVSTNDTASYYGRPGIADVDWHESGNADGGHAYRSDLGPGMEFCGDTPRPQFAAAGGAGSGVYDYDLGWTYNNGTSWTGDWANYTRSFPSNVYNIYGRLSGGGGFSKVGVWKVTSGAGTPSQTTVPLGEFHFTSHGWQAYDFIPLTDDQGNLVKVTLNGVTTLRVMGDNANHNFFMVAPARDDLPVIGNLYPSGSHPFEPTNTLRFTASSTVATIPTDGIKVTLNGLDVSSLLNITGTANNRSVALAALAMNAIYTANISVKDALGTVVTRTIKFDTFSESNRMFEAEDYDFDNAKYINNPVLSTTISADNYYYLWALTGYFATPGVDIATNYAASGAADDYRRSDIGVGTQPASDYLRQAYVAAQTTDPGVRDYNVGWWTSGSWMNYTRDFAAGTYSLYGRMASPSVIGATLGVVTDGVGTANQTVANIGSFTGSANGWQDWIWAPVNNASGKLATFTLPGKSTLRVSNTTGNVNGGYYMLIPAKLPVTLKASASAGHPVISFPSQAGASYTIFYKNSLADADWSLLTIVLGDGTTKTVVDSTAGASRFYRALVQ